MADPDWTLPAAEVEAIVSGRHGDPFAVLGLHEAGTEWVARAFVPGAEELEVLDRDGKRLVWLPRRHAAGFFEGPLPVSGRQTLGYLARNQGGSWTVIDPYLLGPVLGPLDDHYIGEGNHLRLHDRLGAHPMRHEGHEGVHFAVWAPNASRVSVVGDFNGWDGRRHVMRKRRDTGVWEIFIPGAHEGQCYKFELLDSAGKLLPLKSDPFGFSAEMRPKTASKVARTDNFQWEDKGYLDRRRTIDQRRAPMSIYEVHLGSWRRWDDGRFLTYEELADTLIPYVTEMGFTHIELLPVSEHPFDPSWGYQPTGLYAPTSRFGDPAGFARFVDRAHRSGIGVILDWVPAHFPTDEHGLARFDGTALYEHEDPRQGFHPDWNTAIYNFGRREVSSFLLNNALYWLERYHVDGLRVDAVASMLYLDYSRKEGEWIPNEHGGRENLEAIAFLQRVNHEAYGQNPGIVTIAEESTAFPGVSKPTSAGGLGFGFKWNMGFMHDTLSYLKREPIHRKHHQNELTFGLLYAFSENFVLPLSHDEVVHGKGSLLNKMAGDAWQKFASLRAYYAFMWGYPGKKLLFMGQEFAPWGEWSEARSLDWNLLEHAPHHGVQSLVRDLNHVYRGTPALHARDCEPEGFEWLTADDKENSVFAWARHSGDGHPIVVVVSNFTPVPRTGYALPFPVAGRWRELINTDAHIYGGSDMGNMGAVVAEPEPLNGKPAQAIVTLPPLATLYFMQDG
ncbi:1,4-alpha-glucan branching enzyme [Aestuariivirga litoralis]|uniref:1,4-alpha-glucan branching enzyme GlgB n=1 Tax=Aestuariivirga litoralis TaxID=2650924 RepID=A0A2W2B8V4_9HYPH|nr:1,4-alpha-glucan branching protein GlgB [Aestuariivirga litoralis]PZF76508.1 1,4-alpha-glucan branching enzyme [Aestuariivirga litoralis]